MKRRAALYAIESARSAGDDFVLHALGALRPHIERLVILAPATTNGPDKDRLSQLADGIRLYDGEQFAVSAYATALSAETHLSEYDELLLTGDAWFGPLGELGAVFSRMDSVDVDAWDMIGVEHGPPPGFPGEGFPAVVTPWRWTLVRKNLLADPQWGRYWSEIENAKTTRTLESERMLESEFLRYFAQRGFLTAAAFPAESYPTGDPGLHDIGLLLNDGCPIVPRLAFRLFPPFLDQRAILGREILAAIEARGYPTRLVFQNLVRVVPPKALSTNLGLLNVIPDTVPTGAQTPGPAELLAIVHVSDLDAVDELLQRLAHLPPYDLVLTTTDGMRATRLQRRLESRSDLGARQLEIRVTPDNPGRDMSDLMVGCRDLVLEGRYDLVIKLHSRSSPTKTVNRLRYFRRYQWDNLLGSPGYVRNVFALFDREPGLGMVFPPAMHVGYSILGRGWAGLEDASARVSKTLGIGVPRDLVSPHAPFGGMWIARPAALRRMAEHRWNYGDYRRTSRARELAHVQERLLVSSAAEDGYHVRTVLTREHAAISHTALQFKADEISAATRGYPLDQIQFLHRAGWMGRGGPVPLARMYLRLNHWSAARALLPLYRMAIVIAPFISTTGPSARKFRRGLSRLRRRGRR